MPHFNLLDRPCEPLSRRQEPASNSQNGDDAHCDDGVVECLFIDRIGSREAEDDGDEADPCNSHSADGSRHEAKTERTFGIAIWVDQRNEDGDTVGEIETYSRDGCRGTEGDGRAKGGKGEEEGEKGG